MSETVISWTPPNIVSIALMMFIVLTIIGTIGHLISRRKNNA